MRSDSSTITKMIEKERTKQERKNGQKQKKAFNPILPTGDTQSLNVWGLKELPEKVQNLQGRGHSIYSQNATNRLRYL